MTTIIIISNLTRDKKISTDENKEKFDHKKISTDENEEKFDQFMSAAKKPHERTIYSKHLIHISCWMDGSLVFSYFTKTNSAWNFLMAEIRHRNIKRPKTVEHGPKNKPKKTVRIRE